MQANETHSHGKIYNLFYWFALVLWLPHKHTLTHTATHAREMEWKTMRLCVRLSIQHLFIILYHSRCKSEVYFTWNYNINHNRLIKFSMATIKKCKLSIRKSLQSATLNKKALFAFPFSTLLIDREFSQNGSHIYTLVDISKPTNKKTDKPNRNHFNYYNTAARQAHTFYRKD